MPDLSRIIVETADGFRELDPECIFMLCADEQTGGSLITYNEGQRGNPEMFPARETPAAIQSMLDGTPSKLMRFSWLRDYEQERARALGLEMAQREREHAGYKSRRDELSSYLISATIGDKLDGIKERIGNLLLRMERRGWFAQQFAYATQTIAHENRVLHDTLYPERDKLEKALAEKQREWGASVADSDRRHEEKIAEIRNAMSPENLRAWAAQKLEEDLAARAASAKPNAALKAAAPELTPTV